MIKLLKRLFVVKTDRDVAHEYLGAATDLVDLERRQRQIDRGQAPWQTNANNNLKGWV